MNQVLLSFKNEEKGRFLLDFLRQIDFVEIKNVSQQDKRRRTSKAKLENILLNAPVLNEQEIENIEKVGKGFNHWVIKEF